MTLAYFLGDSLTSATFATELCTWMGWTYVNAAPPTGTLDGEGGTGYATGNTYGSRLHYVFDADPDVVFVIGGGNDNGLADGVVVAAVEKFWADLRAGIGAAALYTSPLHRPPGAVKLAAIVDAAALAGATYIDAGTWAPTTSDGIHPTTAGAQYMARRMAYVLGVNRVSGITASAGVPLALERPTQ